MTKPRTPAYYRRRSLARGATVVALAFAGIAIGTCYIIGVAVVFDAVTGR